MGEYVVVALREALLANPEPDAVLRYAELAPYDTAVVEACLAQHRDPRADPALPMLRAKLALAED